MKKILLPLLMAAGFNDLNESSSETMFVERIKQLIDKADECQKVKTELEALKSKLINDEVELILKEALDAHKITHQMAEKLRKTYAQCPKDLRELLSCVESKQKVEVAPETTSNYAQMSWDDLDRAGKLAELKASDPEMFAQKFNEKFK